MSYNWKHLIKNDRKTWSNSNSRLGEGKYFVSGEEGERRRKRRKIFGEVKYFSGGEEKRRRKKRKILAEGKYLARGGEENRKRKRRKILFGTTSLSIILCQSQGNQVY